ncbi:protein MIS12 homolog [Bicyclus anynana]|uniref:Protein MIS12 homolog n=1 Tax=Bicyclus anynana TaxID=110368 RepID=A0A6J1N1E3_BICAN|nr:protein MIS12 homolog [Bicyclus anynana]
MEKAEPWTGGTDEEYETQHFGFGAQRFKLSVRQMVEQKIQSAYKEMESFLQQSVKITDEEKVALTEACNKLVRMHLERAGPSLENIDKEIESMMQVPHNVLLPEDEVQLEEITDEEYSKLQDEVADLRRRLEQSTLMVTLLTAEEEELSSAAKVCEIAKKDMEVLDSLHKNLEESGNARKLLNEVQFLRASVPIKEDDEDNFFDDKVKDSECN